MFSEYPSSHIDGNDDHNMFSEYPSSHIDAKVKEIGIIIPHDEKS